MISDQESYFLSLVSVEEVPGGKYQIFPVNTLVQDPDPETPIKFETAPKAWNWWVHYCENSSSIVAASNNFAKEAARYRKSQA